jgi:urea carboxylase system permease
VITDTEDLARFGYPQQLRRRLGGYASFAAGFSFVSILTTVFQLFAFGFSFGGTEFFWTWPLVFAGQLAVALVFAELAARYPIAGCVYQWSRRVSGPLVGWFAGWLMLLGQIVCVAGAAIALQVVLPVIWPGFQLIDGPGNAILLGAGLIVLTTVVNAFGIRVMSTINSIGVTCELIGVVVLVLLLFGHAERGPSVVFQPSGVGVGGFLVSALMAAYVLIGFDSAVELAEETRSPRRTAPRAILRALSAAGLGGLLLLLGALVAAPSLTDGNLATGGLPYVLTSQLGSGLGIVLLVDVAIAIIVCTLAIQTAATRMVFSMSRDGVLPWRGLLGRVSPRTGTPIAPAVVVGVTAILVLLLSIGQASLFTAVTSVSVVLVYLAYLLVTTPTLLARLRGRLPASGQFSLGRWGVLVNLVAVVWGLFMTVNIGWPRLEVYDPPYFAVALLAAVLVIGGLLYARTRKVDGGSSVVEGGHLARDHIG